MPRVLKCDLERRLLATVGDTRHCAERERESDCSGCVWTGSSFA